MSGGDFISCFSPLTIVFDANGKQHIYKYDPDRPADELTYRDLKVNRIYKVPCGKCSGCRADHARMWSDRLLMEYRFHSPDTCFFVTLTYDDEHLPLISFFDGDSSSENFVSSLCPDDVTKFLKRLRKKFGKFRYFLSGEYGTSTLRPHYHAIFFGLNLDDLFPVSSSGGFVLYSSPSFDSVWSKGQCLIGRVSAASCSYVARYCLKKQGKDSSFEKFGCVSPFLRMSRRPGIGFDFFSESLYQHPYFFLGDENGAHTVKIPRYFDKLLEKQNPEFFDSVREKRFSLAKMENNNLLNSLSVPYLQQLSVNENSFESKLSQHAKLKF